MIADAVVDLPEPDSPTIATVSPGKMSKSMPWMTSRCPDCDSKAMRRSRTLTSGVRGDGAAHRLALALGSRASRISSPSMMNARTVTVSAIDG